MPKPLNELNIVITVNGHRVHMDGVDNEALVTLFRQARHMAKQTLLDQGASAWTPEPLFKVMKRRDETMHKQVQLMDVLLDVVEMMQGREPNDGELTVATFLNLIVRGDELDRIIMGGNQDG